MPSAGRHRNPADNAVTATYYTLRDARGNVAGLVDAAASSPTAGKLIAGFECGPFGGLSAIDSADPAVLGNPALLCPLLFSTKALEPQLPAGSHGPAGSTGGSGGLYYFGYR